MITALATFDLFSKYAGVETSIKWPNDIYWRDRKAAGILIENIVRGNKWQHAIIGVGININQTQFVNNPHAVSLKQITGKQHDPLGLAEELSMLLTNRINEFKLASPEAILTLYNNHLFSIGKRVNFKKGRTVFNAIVAGVDIHGNLITEQPANAFTFGELEWLR